MTRSKVVNLFLFISYCLILLSGSASEAAREIIEQQQLQDSKSSHDHQDSKISQVVQFSSENKMQGHVHTHTHDSNLGSFFFTINDLHAGKVMPLRYPTVDPSLLPRFLPRKEADIIPFSSAQLLNLLPFFSVSPGSYKAKTIQSTIERCEAQSNVVGETKICATSLESMLDFVRSMLETDDFMPLTTPFPKLSTSLEQNYTISQAKELYAPRVVPCHLMAYPYAVYFCHDIAGETKVFEVSMEAQNGDKVVSLVVCHMDTSTWDSVSLALRGLGIKPGAAAVCHFNFPKGLLWVPVAKT